MMRIRIRRVCVHLPQCPLCGGVTNRTYLATSHSHWVSIPVELCLGCWIDTRREGEPA